jgi:phosphomannomutase
MKINPLIFRAYDVRGIYKKDIDENVFRRIGFCFGKKK